MIPKGTLVIIGGHEEKGQVAEAPSILSREKHPTHFEILGRLIAAIPHIHHVIEIIATASSIPQEMEELYAQAYKDAGFTHVGFIRIECMEDAEHIDAIKRIEYAHAVFFTGGDQVRLTAALKDTAMLTAIRKKYLADPHFIVAGTSAGAMSIPEVIISRGIVEEAILKGDLVMGEGLGLIAGIIVDTHFVKRGRFSRLAYAVTINSSCIGVGLGEDTSLVITNGNEAQCIGSGMVILIDGSGIGATNIAYAEEFTPVAVENLKVHIMAHGCTYMIKERQFTISDKQAAGKTA